MSTGQIAKKRDAEHSSQHGRQPIDEKQQRLRKLIFLAYNVCPGDYTAVPDDLRELVEGCNEYLDGRIKIERRFPKDSSVLAGIVEATKDQWGETFSAPFLPPGVTLSAICIFKPR